MTDLWLSLEHWIKRNVKEINFCSHPTSYPDRSDKYVKNWSLENKIESKVMILNWIITLKIMNNWNYVIIRHIREK